MLGYLVTDFEDYQMSHKGQSFHINVNNPLVDETFLNGWEVSNPTGPIEVESASPASPTFNDDYSEYIGSNLIFGYVYGQMTDQGTATFELYLRKTDSNEIEKSYLVTMVSDGETIRSMNIEQIK